MDDGFLVSAFDIFLINANATFLLCTERHAADVIFHIVHIYNRYYFVITCFSNTIIYHAKAVYFISLCIMNTFCIFMDIIIYA